MSSQLINTINRLLHSYEWSSESTISPETKEQYERGLDVVHAYRGDPDQLFEALKVFQAIPSRPYAFAGIAYTLLAASYRHDTEYQPEGLKETAQWLVEAQSLAPDQVEINFIVAMLYVLQKRDDEARSWLNALALKPPNYYVCLAEMRYWEHRRDIHKVYDWYVKASKAAERSEQRIYAIHMVAGSLLEADLPMQASEMYEHLAQYTPDDPWLWHNLSIAYYQQGQYEKASECNQRALQLMDFEAARQMTQRLKNRVQAKEEKSEEKVSRYEMIKTFYGSMGIVHLCRDRQNDSAVALKTLRPDLLSDEDARQRFLQEGTAWVKLGTHPHIVPADRVYDHNNNDSKEIFIVLKWMEPAAGKANASLRAWLKPGKPLPLQQALTFGLHIVRGMQHATTTIPGLVHRDLKPANVLIGYDDQARVTDFGLVAVIGNEKTSTQEEILANPELQVTNNSAETPLYMAPEQWAYKEVDLRTDIYAFGCILYEMVTGQPAAEGNSLTEVALAHTSGQLRPLPANTPQPIQTLIAQTCATVREKRYANWDEVERAVAKAYHEVTGHAAPPLPVEEKRALNLLDLGWSYNALGMGYADMSKHDVAYKYFEDAYQMGQAECRRHLLQPQSAFYKRAERLENVSLTNMGVSYLDRGMLEQAEELLERSLKMAEENKNRFEEARALGNLGTIYLQQDKLQKAQIYFMRDLAITRKVGEQATLAITLSNLGTAEMKLGQLPRARDHFEEVLEAIQHNEDLHMRFTIVSNLATIYRKLRDLPRSVEYSRQQQELANTLGHRQAESQALGYLANVSRDQGDIEQAIKLYEQRLSISNELGEHLALAESNLNLAQIYTQKENWAKSIPYAERAVQEFEKAGQTDGIEQISLALVSNREKVAAQALSQKEYAQARSQLELALDSLRQIDHKKPQLDILNNLSQACRLQKDWPPAKKYAQEAQELAQKLKKRTSEVQALLNLARLEQAQGHRTQALEQYEHLIELTRAQRQWLQLSQVNLAVAEMLAEEEKWIEAKPYATTALEMRARMSGKKGADEIRSRVNRIQEQAEKEKPVGFWAWLMELFS